MKSANTTLSSILVLVLALDWLKLCILMELIIIINYQNVKNVGGVNFLKSAAALLLTKTI